MCLHVISFSLRSSPPPCRSLCLTCISLLSLSLSLFRTLSFRFCLYYSDDERNYFLLIHIPPFSFTAFNFPSFFFIYFQFIFPIRVFFLSNRFLSQSLFQPTIILFLKFLLEYHKMLTKKKPTKKEKQIHD